MDDKSAEDEKQRNTQPAEREGIKPEQMWRNRVKITEMPDPFELLFTIPKAGGEQVVAEDAKDGDPANRIECGKMFPGWETLGLAHQGAWLINIAATGARDGRPGSGTQTGKHTTLQSTRKI